MHVRIDQLEQRMDKKIIEHEQRISDNEKQIALIFNKLQILQITLINFDAQAHEFSQIGWRKASFPRRRESPNLLDKFTPHLLSTALAEHDF